MGKIAILHFAFFMLYFSWIGHTSKLDDCKIHKKSIEVLANDLLVVQLFTTHNYNNSGPVHDSFGIHFAIGNDNALNAQDAVKPMNFYENLGINHNGTILSYESREMPQTGE